MNAYELADTLETLTTNPNNGEITFHVNPIKEIIYTLREQATLIDYYKVRDNSYQKTIAELEKEVKELHKIAQVMAMKESDARKSLQNYKDGVNNA